MAFIRVRRTEEADAMALHQEIHGLGTEEIVELAEAVAERGEPW